MSIASTFDQPKTQAMRMFLVKERRRVIAMSIEPDGVFIYTHSAQWCDDAGSGTFRGDNETAAIRRFYERVRPTPQLSEDDLYRARADYLSRVPETC